MHCKTCGDKMIGDGFTVVMHCCNVDIFEACAELDAKPLHCKPEGPESTEQKRVWYSGPPPHVGWWNASHVKTKENWSWWNGAYWSNLAGEQRDAEYAGQWAKVRHPDWLVNDMLWTDYWPTDARVPRLAPEDFEIGARWVCVNPVWSWEFRGLEFRVTEVTDIAMRLESYRSVAVEKLETLPSTYYVPRRCVGPQTRWDFPMPKDPCHG